MTKRILLTAAVFFLAVGTMLAQQFESGKVRIKFKSEMTAQLDGIMTKQGKEMGRTLQARNGFVQMGIADVDGVNQLVQAQEMTRVFRPAGKFEARHREWGLHLWYEVKFNSQAELKEIMNAYGSLTSIEIAERVNVYSLNDSFDATAEALATVESFEAPMTIAGGTPNDPSYSQQWGYPAINAAQAWEIETGHSSVVVAIEDQGVDYNHPDLDGNMWTNPGEIPGNGIDDDNNGYTDDVYGWNFGNNNSNIAIDYHGTHVGGTVSAETNNGVGVAGTAGGSGSNDGVRLMSLSVFGNGAQGRFDEAFIYAADNGAAISQNSWGGGAQSSALETAIDYFRANGGGSVMNGGLVVFAAGNDNSSSPSIGYPGSYSSCLAVASIASNWVRSSFSNYGSWVDISAPGSAIYSTYPLSQGSYASISGTSMACPHVSGVAALVLSKRHRDGLTTTDDELWSLVVDNANPILYNTNGSYSGQLGSGMLDAYASLTGQPAPPPPAPACQVSGTSDVVLTINTDNYGSETSWTLQDTLGTTLASGSGYANNSSYTETFTGITGHLIFTINDSYGDGICCSYGSGSYSLVDGDGTTLASGGAFGSSEQTVMCISAGDGGGGDPPGGGDCTTVISSNSFETAGTSIWSNGTGDDVNWAANTGGTPSSGTGPSGAYDGSTYIYQEASGNGTGYPNKRGDVTATVDLTGATCASIEFAYHLYSSSNVGGTLSLSANGTTVWSVSNNQGSSWQTATVDLSAYAGGSVSLVFSGQTASSWRSDICLDAITIKADAGAPAAAVANASMASAALTGLSVYPNPTNGTLHVTNIAGVNAQVKVMNLAGQVMVNTEAAGNELKLDVNGLPNGLYILQVNDGGEVSTTKFIKQ